MREMKFRVWDIEENRLSEVFSFDTLAVMFEDDFVPLQFAGIRTERFVFSQFTGLQDVGLKDIFEGDLVSIPGWQPKVYQIRFIHGHFVLAWFGKECKQFKDGDYAGDIR